MLRSSILSNIEAWKSATSLQMNPMIRDLPRILILALLISYNFESFKNTPILQNILHDACETRTKTQNRCIYQKQISKIKVKR